MKEEIVVDLFPVCSRQTSKIRPKILIPLGNTHHLPFIQLNNDLVAVIKAFCRYN